MKMLRSFVSIVIAISFAASLASKTGVIANAETVHHPSPFYYKDLVELTSLDDTFIIDQRYATSDNFTGRVHYDTVLCLIHKDIASRLLKAERLAKSYGLRIKVFDAYRPVSVQQSLYDSTPKELRMYVAKPSQSSLHPKGLAVDITLVGSNGKELDMPSKFDDFSVKAHVDYEGANERQKKNRALLIDIMTKSGFKVNSTEWWHYYVPESSSYPLLDVQFIHFLRARSGRFNISYTDTKEHFPSEDLYYRSKAFE